MKSRYDERVYITSHGASFHHSGHFLQGKLSVLLNDALEEGYTPCTSCWWPDKGTPQVQAQRDATPAYRRLYDKEKPRDQDSILRRDNHPLGAEA